MASTNAPETADLIKELTSKTPTNPIRDRTLANIAALEAKLRGRDPKSIIQAQKKTMIDQLGQWEEVVQVMSTNEENKEEK